MGQIIFALGKSMFISLGVFLGLPRPAGGSGYVAARRSARPCAFFASLKKLGLAFGHCYLSLSQI
ncbi:hypothetical protein SGRA_1274 [Saprospira grandis str. Lewin]|uniref:Uncharacterized protein n=1 Tax=Saprospira grandis (strain Lewin) TaxID=984262 RepID=H6L595_SAPGL|nr:hypothetical protein SGRA_1274 [Saprospira grandis str. Lewin]